MSNEKDRKTIGESFLIGMGTKDARILANILAALRLAQTDAHWAEFSKMPHFMTDVCPPMSPDEIEQLCEDINLSDTDPGTIRVAWEVEDE